MMSSPKVSTSTSHGGGYRCSASATRARPTPRRRADDRTASHAICLYGAARSIIPPRTWPLGSRTHSAVPRLIFRRSVDSKSGIGPNKGSTSRAISSQDATSSSVPSLTALTRTECPSSGPPGTQPRHCPPHQMPSGHLSSYSYPRTLPIGVGGLGVLTVEVRAVLGLELGCLVAGQGDFQGRDGFVEVTRLGRPDDRCAYAGPGEQPRQRDLGGWQGPLDGDGTHGINDIEVLGPGPE